MKAFVCKILFVIMVAGFFVNGVGVKNIRHEGSVEIAYAQNFDKLEIPKPRTLPGPTASNQGKTYLRDTLIVTLTRYFVSFVGGVALLFFILGGVRMLTSYGDEGAITAAKKTVIWAVIGFLLAVFSYVIIGIIGNVQLDAPTSSSAATTTSTSSTTKP